MATFSQGIIYAAGYLVRWHGYDSVALELLRGAGLDTWADLKRARPDNYDLENLRPLFFANEIPKVIPKYVRSKK